MKITITGWFPFPHGNASSSRIRSIASGLIKSGCEVTLLTTARIPWIAENRVGGSGTPVFKWDSAFYSTTNCFEGQQRWRSGQLLLAQLKAVFLIRKEFRRGNIDALFIYSRSFLFLFPVLFLSKICKIAVVADQVEWYPVQYFKYGWLNPFFWDDWLGRQLMLRYCDMVTAITYFTASHFESRDIACMIMPSLFDYSQSHLPPARHRKPAETLTLGYAGNCKKDDGVDDLLSAVRRCRKEGYDVRVRMLGCDGFSGHSLAFAKLISQDRELSQSVVFVGRVPEDAYLAELGNCDCLVLPRPNKQTVRAAFPTRLPEFLSTGRPVLTTSVPDVPVYLNAGEHAFITQPGPIPLAQGIKEIADDPTRAEQVGKAGRVRGMEVFDYITYTSELAKKIEELVARR